MEVKINREIRNYTESMFFGLTMRQFVFLCWQSVLPWGCTFCFGLMWEPKPCPGGVCWGQPPLRRWASCPTTA